MSGSAVLLPVVMSKKSFAYRFGSAPILYNAGLMSPSPPPLIWSAIATRPAHCGHDSDVPPMSYQPVLHGADPQIRPLCPARGSVMYTSAPVPALAWNPTSGTPRMLPIAVLPPGSASWYDGLPKTWLKPPPENVQPTSACVGFALHRGATFGDKIVRDVVLSGSVHRYVPPTPVTNGSDAGHSTVGNENAVPPWPTGDFLT